MLWAPTLAFTCPGSAHLLWQGLERRKPKRETEAQKNRLVQGRPGRTQAPCPLLTHSFPHGHPQSPTTSVSILLVGKSLFLSGLSSSYCKPSSSVSVMVMFSPGGQRLAQVPAFTDPFHGSRAASCLLPNITPWAACGSLCVHTCACV